MSPGALLCSQEEYTDVSTLETRLKDVAQLFAKPSQGQGAPAAQQQHRQPYPTAAPQPQPGMGMGAPYAQPMQPPAGPGPGSASTFVPTPMGGAPMGMDPSMQGQRVPGMQNGSGMPSASGMVPTPGGPDMGGMHGMGMAPGGMVPTPAGPMSYGTSAGNHISGSTVMQNGAPVMIKREPYSVSYDFCLREHAFAPLRSKPAGPRGSQRTPHLMLHCCLRVCLSRVASCRAWGGWEVSGHACSTFQREAFCMQHMDAHVWTNRAMTSHLNVQAA